VAENFADNIAVQDAHDAKGECSTVARAPSRAFRLLLKVLELSLEIYSQGSGRRGLISKFPGIGR